MSLDLVTASITPLAVLRRVPQQERVLTQPALDFVAEMQARFGTKLNALMVARDRRQERMDRGTLPAYAADTADIRKGLWEVPSLPAALYDRRAETAGPAPAAIKVADREDRGPARFADIIAANAKAMDDNETVTILRPRALDVSEANLMAGGHPVSAALFDVALHMFHNARALAATGRGPFYELAKLESPAEARFWNEVFAFAEGALGLQSGTARVTVCIETLYAAYEMDEIVWDLRDSIVALSLNRANLTAAYIRAMRAHADRVLPADIPHDRAFLASCAARLVKVAHRRGILAIGDAQPEYEARAGFDGSRSDNPSAALAVYADEVAGPNQLRIPRQGWRIEPEMLAQPHQGDTAPDAAALVTVAISELAAWISGAPARMDLAELARMRLWQWQRHGAIPTEALDETVQREILDLLGAHGPTGFHRGHYATAARIVQQSVRGDVQGETLAARARPVIDALE